MTTDAILVSLHMHATHSHGKVCFADICSMLPGSIHGANIIPHTNLCYISLVCLERTRHPEGMLHGQGALRHNLPLHKGQRLKAGSHPTARKGRWDLDWDGKLRVTWRCQPFPVTTGDESSGLQALPSAQIATAWEPTTFFTRFGRYEIRQLHIILPKRRCLQL